MRVVIIGLSAAGSAAAEAVRRQDPAAEITVLNGEKRPFYLRLDLGELFGGKTAEQLQPRPDDFWREKRITVLPVRATGLDIHAKEVLGEDGGRIAYDRLLIATGASPRRLAVPGHNLGGISGYHTMADVERILQWKDRIGRVVVIGGGILGLEMAQISRRSGWETSLVVRHPFPGQPMLDARGGGFLKKALDRAGIRLYLDEEVAAFTGEQGQLKAVVTTGGREIAADAAFICIGVEPETGFLRGSGVLTDERLVVNDRLETAVPGVFAAGDVAVVRTEGGEQISCFTWTVASAQGRTAGANLCGAGTVWKPETLFDPDHLFDQDFTLIGDWMHRHRQGRIITEITGEDHYRAVVTADGILESAFLLGDRTGDSLLRKLIARRAVLHGDVRRLFQAGAQADDFLPHD
jgi:NAD(P)H-nitrite reductase large subunit